MVHPETGSVLVFNGEVYNFVQLRRSLEAKGAKVRSSGDTEVLLHALEHWGPDCLPRLQGMYAFAWLTADRLLLARDPLGIKPLYVAAVPGAFLFASEVRALLASGLVPRRMDRRGMAGLLAYGAVQHPYTLVESVASFPPGHWQGVEAPESPAAPRAFFEFPRPRIETDGPDAARAVRSTLEAAVRDHLVSDVPVGVFLSSGLDSTIVAALAAACTPRLRSFTVGFADEPDLSETRLAAETARGLGLDHTEVLVSAPDALRLTEQWLGRLDQPSMDGLSIYLISDVVRKAGVTVALSGQGGDELFGGYPSFAEVPRLLALRQWLGWLPVSFRRGLLTTATLGRNNSTREKLADIAASPARLVELYFRRRRAISDRQMARLAVDAASLGLTDSFQAPQVLAELPDSADDPVWLISQLETRFYQGNMLLRDGDACSMAHGLELRVPMLDQRLVELAFSLPGSVRLPNGAADKHLLREAFAPVLRPALLDQAKRGFALPLQRWLLRELRPLAEEALASLKGAQLLDPAGIDGIWSRFLSEPESPAWSRALILVVLGSYLERNALT
jgi:asparagine synthase (glutamine-hydrolysing)